MHYCCLVFTKEFPTDDVLYNVLEPFSEKKFYETEEENKEYPEFLWDWYKVGGRYSGNLKLKVKDSDEKYEWAFYYPGGRNGVFFRSKLIDTIKEFAKTSRDGWLFKEEDIYNELGFSDGYIRVDACPVCDILNIDEIGCYYFVGKNGNAYSRSKWNGEEDIKHNDFELKLKEEICNSKDCFLCVVDLHD